MKAIELSIGEYAVCRIVWHCVIVLLPISEVQGRNEEQ